MSADSDPSAELVGLMGRQLREPLHALVGLVDLLESTRLPADTRDIVALVRTEVLDLRSRVDDLIDASELQASALAMRLRPVALGALVSDVMHMAAARAASDAVHLAAEIGPGVPSAVLVDPARLRQLLDRLVAHVLARTTAGRITLAVDGPTVGDDAGGVHFKVSGPIALGVVDGSVVLAEQLAKVMGGSVTVSEQHAFQVWLPLVATDLPPVDLEQEPTLAASDVHVLVVDDEPVNRMLAVEQLARLGMRATAVGTGEEAVDVMAVNDPPQLVLMDVVMPGIDGLEATRRVREGERRSGRRAVIIGITASSLATDRLAADEAGMDDVLGKPVSLGMLTDAIGKWVRGGLQTGHDPNAVDPTAIDDLCADLGGASLVSNVVRMYLNELHGRRLALAEAVDRGDLAAAKAVAHTLKSGSAMLGARRVADACEQVGRLHTTVDLHQATADVMRTSTAAARWLHDWLARQP